MFAVHWEMKEDKYAKSLAKTQVFAIFHMRDIRKNVLPKFVWRRHAMFVSLSGAEIWPPETNRNIYGVNSSLEELIKIKVIFILRQGMFR